VLNKNVEVLLMNKNESCNKMERIKATAQEYHDKTVDSIKKHPVKSVLIAAGVGAALGALTVALLKRRRG
jgi:ElaB/YqjD/DUF883 family membrane-anchored ribosome-binding protein